MLYTNLTPKMQARYDNCPLVQRHQRAPRWAPRAQVQVSPEIPMSHGLYASGGVHYMCASVKIWVSVPTAWGEYQQVFERSVPREYLMRGGGVCCLSDEEFAAQVERVVAEVAAIAQQHREAE